MLKKLYWRTSPLVKRRLLRSVTSFRAARFVNLSVTLSINGRPFVIPIRAGVGFQNVQMTEMWMVKVLELLLPLKKGVFLDVGANIGQSLLKLRAVSNTVPYLGLEPNPACAAYLGELIRLNRFDRTIVIPVGLHNSRAILDLRFFAEGNTVDSGATLVQDPAFRPRHPVAFRQPVPVFPFSDLSGFLDGARPGVVKIDVEGGEMEVLDSLRDLVEIERCPILVEILPMGDPKSTIQKNARLEAFFGAREYRLFRVEKNRQRFERFRPIRDIGPNEDPGGWDYLAIPAELRGGVAAGDANGPFG